ncbi:hypothetical protein [Methylotenera mobilis]|uniref:hypothetical protein n=1 Tax=Methylotenera mobilis TaxID=359408 RepID=UPI00039A0521|nr:hypothetical protein [Methylotenera mobilis]PPC97727.1 MAG: hypothetical protein CTY32_00580 [Methylotenera sp.]
MINNRDLASCYLRLINDIDVSYLDRSHPNTKCGNNMLSGMFLPSIPDGYEQSRNKIMIIGRETRAWNVLKPDEKLINLESYIDKAITTHKNHSYKELNKKEESRGQSYFKFVRKVKMKSGESGLIHANLFCFSWKKRSPLGCPHEEVVKRYSERLLKFQIEYFKPDIIIFAHGSAGIKFRHQLFPYQGENNVCIEPIQLIPHPHLRSHFWEFDLYGKYKSYRVPHPSGLGNSTRQAHDYLISILPQR